MNSSLYTAVLGLENHQTRMDVIGNNIANVNTYGFKRGRVSFADLLSRTYQGASAPANGHGGTNAIQVGLGVTTAAITNIMTQGQTETTGRLADVALDGNGWFVLQNGAGQNVYTRDGSFSLDRDGSYVNANGWRVQGWTTVNTDADHNFTVNAQTPTSNINFQPGEKLAAQATNEVGLKCNLKSDSRSVIADGIDPKEGYATADDPLVDLYNLPSGQATPNSLGLKEGDWIEVKAQAAYHDGSTLATDTFNAVGQAGQNSYSLISDGNVPVRIQDGAGGFSIQVFDPATATTTNYTQANEVIKDPDKNNDGVVDNLAANQWVYDPGTGRITLGTAPAAGANITINYVKLATCQNTMPWEDTKYYYFQLTNDTKISDLGNAIQQTLDALDVNGSINAKSTFNPATGTFDITNNAVNGSLDENSVSVQVNAVSGSAIRRGFELQDSTDKNVKGTRLGIVAGNLGGNMDSEKVSVVDYQNDVVNLDYGNVDKSTQLFGQVVNTRVWKTFTAASDGANGIFLSEFSGYTNNGNLQLTRTTDVLSVNGTVWTRVPFFTGAANEYVITDGNETTPPTVIFNNVSDAAGNPSLLPSDGADVVMTFRPSNAPKVQLTENVSYTLDQASGRISLMWTGAASDPKRMLGQGLGAADLTGSIQISANYTTEQRKMAPPQTIMDSRWADFAQGFAQLNEGGDGKARVDFDNMFSTLEAGAISDQATSAQPTGKSSSLFLSGATHRTSISVYDSLGAQHQLQFVFTHIGSFFDTAKQEKYQNEWVWRAELPYSDTYSFDSMDMPDANNIVPNRDNGVLQFDNTGLLQATKLAGNTGPISFDASPIGLNGNTTGSVQENVVSANFTPSGKGPIGGVTQYASDFTTLAFEQNGWAMGMLQTFSIDQNGVIQGSYSNNVVKPIAQIALAMFPNEEGLTKLGNNLFGTSANSGTPTIVPAYVGGAGQIKGSSLEMSNVDIAQEFTDMIVTERGFQANSRMVTTSDEMLTEVLNMKR